jgi:uncharacterized membrane protein
MALEPAGTERLNAFSDGVIAVIITIMVLELHAPHETTVAAFLHLWPTFASYAISFLFVAIVWTNHHHMLRFARHANAKTIWANFLFLFVVSLIPFSTAYIAETRISPVATALYAAVFVGVNLTFQLLQVVIFSQHMVPGTAEPGTAGLQPDGHTHSGHEELIRASRKQSWISLVVYSTACLLAWVHPAISLGMIVGMSLLYIVPDAIGKKFMKGRATLGAGLITLDRRVRLQNAALHQIRLHRDFLLRQKVHLRLKRPVARQIDLHRMLPRLHQHSVAEPLEVAHRARVLAIEKHGRAVRRHVQLNFARGRRHHHIGVALEPHRNFRGLSRLHHDLLGLILPSRLPNRNFVFSGEQHHFFFAVQFLHVAHVLVVDPHAGLFVVLGHRVEVDLAIDVRHRGILRFILGVRGARAAQRTRCSQDRRRQRKSKTSQT